MGCSATDFLFDLFAGDHDKDLSDLIKPHTGAIAMLPWQNLDGAAGQAWQEVGRMVGVHKQVVSASTLDGAPPQSSRNLRRTLTAEAEDDEARASEMDAERTSTWKTLRWHGQHGRRWALPT